MSITDELREFVEGHLYLGATVLGGWKEAALIIADRIDAEHESACAEAYGNGVMSVPIALDESAWVKLPVDADGAPIHVGDRLDGYNRTIGVQEMRWCGDCRWDVVDEYGDEWHDNYAFTHHHAQAIEATLGRGTCHNAMPLLPGGGMPYPDSWMCSECGGRMDGVILETGNYCPNCGRKVVDE